MTPTERGGLPHLTESGSVHMVDVGGKPDTQRMARAEGFVVTTPRVVQLAATAAAAKGDVLAVARVAGIQAAKRTPDWIPLAHPVAVSGVKVELTLLADRIRVETWVSTHGPTGVEMEALTAAAAACLTVYDMLKAEDRGMTLGPIRLLTKSGGASGTWERADVEVAHD